MSALQSILSYGLVFGYFRNKYSDISDFTDVKEDRELAFLSAAVGATPIIGLAALLWLFVWSDFGKYGIKFK